MKHEFGIMNSEVGIPNRPPRDLNVVWDSFRIPNSEFRIGWVGGWM
jgi:hypothetical protein